MRGITEKPAIGSNAGDRRWGYANRNAKVASIVVRNDALRMFTLG